MALSEREARQIEEANRSDRTPVVFIHGLWLLPSSWDRWAGLFEEAGYATVQPDWPGDPETVEQARANPDVFAGTSIAEILDHTSEVIVQLEKRPAVVGHSFGGMFTQIIAGRGLSDASVAIDPAPFRGIFTLPVSTLRSAAPILMNPLNRNRAKTLTFDQFKYGWANALDDEQARRLYDQYHVAGSGRALFDGANANLNPGTAAKVDTKNSERGPLLLISGDTDHTVPTSVVHAEYKKQQDNPRETEFETTPNRGHSLTIDDGWQEVAQAALDFVKRFA
ncbi:MAG TPA: alpha/beta hydrolase [Solirubrobacterales bacterium]|nr:alpha/beta hydrolase [Solirubrobacterales bacterium]